jgi:hypothetical protein
MASSNYPASRVGQRTGTSAGQVAAVAAGSHHANWGICPPTSVDPFTDNQVMKIALKWVLRIIASLFWLLGVFGLAFMGWFATQEETSAVLLAFLFVGIAIDLYLIFVAYLAWFRFSPRAIKHLSGVLILYLYSHLLPDPDDQVEAVGDPWHLAILAGGLFLGFWAWVFLDGLLNRILFPLAPPTDGSSGPRDVQSVSAIDDNETAEP